MKKENINYLAVGTFVLGMLIVLLIALFRITGRGFEGDNYYVSYTNIMGIGEGTTVTYGGYPIGQVGDILPERVNGQTRYKLRLVIQRDWKIPRDSIARITSPGLLSSLQIDINQGQSPHFLAPDDELQNEPSVSLFESMNSVADELNSLSRDALKPLLLTLNRYTETLGKDLIKTIPEIADKIDALLVHVNTTIDQYAKVASPDNRRSIKSILDNTNVLIDDLTMLARDFKRTRGRLDELVADSSKVITNNRDDIRHSILVLRNSLDTFSHNMGVVMYNLEMTTRNMNEFSHRIRNNPSLLFAGSPPEDKADFEQ